MRKQVRINGVPKRALDLVGRLRVVLFLPEDVSLVAGAPAERRRYLDIALCQIPPPTAARSASIIGPSASATPCCGGCANRGGDARQLAFWDTQLAEHGSLVSSSGAARPSRHLDRIAASATAT